MRCSDGHFYVVKFQNNPQHRRVLANEMFATRLAEHIGLPVPVSEVVEADEWLIAHTPELMVEMAHGTICCQAGLQFGSRYVVAPAQARSLGEIRSMLPAAAQYRFDPDPVSMKARIKDQMDAFD